MLRDRDIFIIQYTLDFFSNRRNLQIPDTLDLWPRDPVKQKEMLDLLDARLEESQFADSQGKFAPESQARDNFIVNEVIKFMGANYGPGFEFRDSSERGLLGGHLREEFSSHKKVSLRWPKGEPLMGETQMVFTEHDKIGTDVNYSKTRIYRR